MNNSQEPFRYTEAVGPLQETVHYESGLDFDTFDFETFDTFMGANTNLTAVPTMTSSLVYDEAEHERLMKLPLRAIPDDEWEEEQTCNAPTPARSPIVASAPQLQSQAPIPESASLNIVMDFAPQPEPIHQREQKEGTDYLNPILNSFSNPSYPLKVIDRLQYPFAQELQAALQRELANQLPSHAEDFWSQGYQAESRNLVSKSLQSLPQHFIHAPQQPAPLAKPRASSPDASVVESSTTTKKAGNKRPSNIKNFNTSTFYSSLPHAPLPWGEGPYPGELLFHYTSLGELNPTSTYTTQEIISYIQFHPLNTYNNKRSGLTLWIQVAPADSGKRYVSAKSDKCRFECCPDPQRTIRKGDFRVAFDEQHSKGLNTDPFHNAGYVHLYCMEKFIDFPSICQNYNVRPDTRKLKEGKSKMAITRDHASMQDVALNFIQNAKPWNEFGGGIRPEEYYEHTLCYQLTVEHLARQPRHLQKIREKRGGNSIDTHLNNLDKYLAGRKTLGDQRKAGLRPNFGTKGSKKRKAGDDDGEDELEKDMKDVFGEDWDDVLDENILDKKPKGEEQGSLRKIKKPRRG